MADKTQSAKLNSLLSDFFSADKSVLGWGTATLDDIPELKLLDRWIKSHYHADLTYLWERLAERRHPKNFKPWANTAVMFALENPIPTSAGQFMPLSVSCYALGKDYHFRCRHILNQIEELYQKYFPGHPFFGFVDTAPVAERTLAVCAGLGWIGKNACLIHPKWGSNFFLGGFFTDIEQPSTGAIKEKCGSCTECLDHCPTRAICEPKVVDARKCISYLTIECKTDFGPYERLLGTRLYGCDNCQYVCPWNKKPDAQKNNLQPSNPFSLMASDWFMLLAKGGGFKSKFKHTPIFRIGRKRMLRNLLTVLIHHPSPQIKQQVISLPFKEEDPGLNKLYERLIESARK